jgi:uncharacterized protein (DUF1697 family)
MIRYVAFLRGINVSGHNLVKMEDLRQYFQMPGIYNVSTYIQSGNVLFESEEYDETVLRAKIEKQLSDKLGYKVPVVLRMSHELKSIIANNPFDHIKTEDTMKIYVTFLTDTPAFSVRGSLGVYSNDAEDARVVKREVYIRTGNYGKTCFSNTVIEKKMGMTATTRNWATINKILELLEYIPVAAAS